MLIESKGSALKLNSQSNPPALLRAALQKRIEKSKKVDGPRERDDVLEGNGGAEDERVQEGNVDDQSIEG